MGIPMQNTHVYSLNFADDQVLISQDHDDMEFMARKLKDEYEKWGLTMNLEKTKYICIGLWSSGQSFWLEIQRSRVRFPALPDFLISGGSGTGYTHPREVN